MRHSLERRAGAILRRERRRLGAGRRHSSSDDLVHAVDQAVESFDHRVVLRERRTVPLVTFRLLSGCDDLLDVLLVVRHRLGEERVARQVVDEVEELAPSATLPELVDVLVRVELGEVGLERAGVPVEVVRQPPQFPSSTLMPKCSR
jgi:hypothetical protein